MLVADDVEERLFGALSNLDRRAFLLGGASSAAVLHGANAQFLMLGVGADSQGGASGPAPIAVSGPAATPSLNFTTANENLPFNHAGVGFPSGAVNAPATAGLPWYMGWQFRVPESIRNNNANFIAHRGSSIVGNGILSVNILANTMMLNVSIGFGGVLQSTPPNVPLQRGRTYTLIHGGLGLNFYFVTLLDDQGTVYYNQVQVAAIGGITANTACLGGLGAACGLNSAQNALGFAGSISNFFLAYGQVPSTNSGSCTATAAFTGGTTTVLSVNAVPAGIAVGQIVMDKTTSPQRTIGTVASWTGTTITLAAAASWNSSGAADALTLNVLPITSGGAAFGGGTLDWGSVAKGLISAKDLIANTSGSTLRYFCPLAGIDAGRATNYGAVSTGSALHIGTAATASAGVSTTANAATSGNLTTLNGSLSLSALPFSIANGMNVWNATSGAQVGTVLSWSGTTVTLFEPNVLSAVTSGDTLVFGRLPPSIRAGQLVFNNTSKLPAGTIASFDVTKNLITISQTNPLNSLANGDALIIGANVRASATVSSGSVLNIDFVPPNIAPGQNVYNQTTSLPVGTVASWDTTANTITISQANPANTVTSGNYISVHGFNADPTSIASTAPMTGPPNWAAAFQPIADDPIIPAAWLSLRPMGEYYVWGVTGVPTPGTTAKVWFDGSYTTSNGATAAGMDGALFRKDTKAPYVNWTALSGFSATSSAGSTIGFAGGYTMPAQARSNTTVAAGASATLTLQAGNNPVPQGITVGNKVYNATTGNLLGTVLGWSNLTNSTITLAAVTSNAVSAGDTLVFGAAAVLIYSTPQPAALPTGSQVTIAGLTTAPVNGIGVTAINGTHTVLNSTPSSVTVSYSGLVRSTNGIQNIGSGTVSWSGFGLYSGYLTASQGAGFSRSVRYAGQATTAVHATEKHGVGIVAMFHDQSNGNAMKGGTSLTGTLANSGASIQLAATDTDNVFCSMMGAWGNGVSNGLSNTAIGDYWTAQAFHDGRHGLNFTSVFGDGFTAFANTLMTVSGLPVMLIDAQLSGHTPPAWYFDRQTVTASSTNPPTTTWTPSPNGTTKNFTLTLQPYISTWAAAGQASVYGGTFANTPVSVGGFNSSGTDAYPIVPGTLTGTVAGISITDDGAGNIVGTGVSGTVEYHGGGGYPKLTLAFVTAPAAAAPFTLSWTSALEYDASTTSNTHINPDLFGSSGATGQPHTGVLESAYRTLGANMVTAILHVWWTANVTSGTWSGGNPSWGAGSFGAALATMDGIRWLNRLWLNAVNAKRFWAPAARENESAASSYWAGAQFGGAAFQVYQYVANSIAQGINDVGFLADCPDVSVCDGSGVPNLGPHADFAGGMIMGQRYAYSVAASLGYGGMNLYSGTNGQVSNTWNGGTGFAATGCPVLGPVLKAVARTASGGNVTGLVLTFDLPNGSSLATQAGGGIGSTVQGFLIGTGTTDAAAFLARTTNGSDTGVAAPFAATITSATQVTIAFTTPSNWPTSNHISLNYIADIPYLSAATFAGYVNDNSVGLGGLLCDNAGGYSLPTPAMVWAWKCPGTPAGNAASAVLSWVA